MNNISTENLFQIDLLHFILHEIPPSQREDIMSSLTRKMKPEARFYMREPVKESHGIPPEEIKELFFRHSLEEIRSEISKKPFMGEMFTGFSEKYLDASSGPQAT